MSKSVSLARQNYLKSKKVDKRNKFDRVFYPRVTTHDNIQKDKNKYGVIVSNKLEVVKYMFQSKLYIDESGEYPFVDFSKSYVYTCVVDPMSLGHILSPNFLSINHNGNTRYNTKVSSLLSKEGDEVRDDIHYVRINQYSFLDYHGIDPNDIVFCEKDIIKGIQFCYDDAVEACYTDLPIWSTHDGKLINLKYNILRTQTPGYWKISQEISREVTDSFTAIKILSEDDFMESYLNPKQRR